MFLPPEVESGNKEYKLKVTTDDPNRIEQLASQMKWRLNEGNGIAEYYLGVADNGEIKNINSDDFKLSMKNIAKIAKIINSKIIYNKKVKCNKIFYYLIKITQNEKHITSTNVIFIGPSQSGKSTIISNLSKNIKDNGNGKSRKLIFNHKHELYSGETSSITIQNKQFNLENETININLIDTPGKSKYLKTTISTLCKYSPDVIFLLIDPLNVNQSEINFYLDLLNFYELNYYIILTKKDIYKNLNNSILKDILNTCNKNKISYIEISNITTKGYAKINKILKKKYDKINNNFKIQICDTLKIPNFPTIYTGITFDEININEKYLLTSPYFEKNTFISSVYFLDKPKTKIESGNLITFTLKNIEIGNKNDLILSKKKIVKKREIKVICDEEINLNQGICIYNNQYNVVKINKMNSIYTLTNIDNSNFINLNDKIILKTDDKYYFMKLI